MATPDTNYDTITQYVNWGDYTTTVDPIRWERWIHEGGDELHKQTADKGREYDRRGMQHTLPLLFSEPTRLTPYLPKISDLAGLPVHEKRPRGSMFDHGVVAPWDDIYSVRNGIITDNRPGQHPIVKHIHVNTHDGPSKEFLEDQYRKHQKLVQDRVHDTATA